MTAKPKGQGRLSQAGAIPWVPFPKTVEDEDDRDGYAAGAIIRARHRQRMVMRWRDKEARDEDRRRRRLPADWHDWMMCPAEDGYRSRWCSCDAPTGNAPREMTMRERELRAALERELHIPIKERQRMAAQPLVSTEPVAVEWVKSIDAPHLSDSMAIRRGREHVQVAQGVVAQDSRLARLGSGPLTLRAPAARKNPHPRTERRAAGRLSGSARVRVPSWLSRVRSYLSMLRPASGTGR